MTGLQKTGQSLRTSEMPFPSLRESKDSIFVRKNFLCNVTDISFTTILILEGKEGRQNGEWAYMFFR